MRVVKWFRNMIEQMVGSTIDRGRKFMGGTTKNVGKGVMVGSVLRMRPDGVVLGAGIYGAGKIIEGGKREHHK